MKAETCSPAQHKIKYDVLDVKCLSFNIELQHIGMSSIKLTYQTKREAQDIGRELNVQRLHTKSKNYYYYIFKN